MNRKALAWQAVLLTATGILLWLALRNVSLRDVWRTLHDLSAGDLLILVALNVSAWILIAARWWLVLLGFDQRISLLRVLRYRLSAHTVSYVTPGPQVGGEVLMVYYPAARHGVPAAVAVAATTVDKALEFVGNFGLLAVGLLAAGTGGTLLSGANLILLLLPALLLAPIAMLVAVWRGYHPASGFLELAIRKFAPARRARIEEAVLSVRRIEELVRWLAHHRPLTFLAALGVTLLAVALLATEFWVMNRVLNIDVAYWHAVGILALVYLAFLLPVPAGLGAMETALVAGFGAVGLATSQALGLALLMRARDVLLALIGALLGAHSYFWSRESMPPGRVPDPAGTISSLDPSS